MFRSRIVKDTIILALMQIFLDFSSIFLNSFITRSLGASVVGVFSLMGSFLGLAGVIASGNAFLCTSRLIAEESGRADGNTHKVLMHGITFCLFMSLLTSAIIIFFADDFALRFFGEESAETIISALRLMPLALVSGSVSSCFKGYFNAGRKARVAAFGDVIEFAVKSAIIIFMVINSRNIALIMTVPIISGNVTSLLFMLLLFSGEKGRTKNKGVLTFGGYVRFAFPIMFGGVLTSVLSSLNDALVPICLKQSGDSQEQAFALFGIFEAIVIPAVFFPSVIPCSLSGIVVTETARASAEGNSQRIRRMTANLLQYTIIYALASSIFLYIFGDEVGEMLGGGEMAGRMISAIAPVVPFIYLEIVLEAIIKGLGLQGFSSLNYLAEYVVRISAVLVLVPHMDFRGIIISYYASNIIGNVSRLVKVIRCTGTGFNDLPLFSSLKTNVHIAQKVE